MSAFGWSAWPPTAQVADRYALPLPQDLDPDGLHCIRRLPLQGVGSIVTDLYGTSSARQHLPTSPAEASEMPLPPPVLVRLPVVLKALEEGVGDAFPIYVIVPVEGQLTLVKGGVFSYYEFTVPLAERLTDEQWQKMSPKPDRPEWTKSFIR